MRRAAGLLFVALLACALPAGCGAGAPAAPLGSCTLPLAEGARDEEAIAALILTSMDAKVT